MILSKKNISLFFLLGLLLAACDNRYHMQDLHHYITELKQKFLYKKKAAPYLLIAPPAESYQPAAGRTHLKKSA